MLITKIDMNEYDTTYLYPSAHDSKKTSKTTIHCTGGVIMCLLYHRL